MERNELKPCLFCGEKPLLVRVEYRHDEALYRVQCFNNECVALPSTYNYDQANGAIDAWNRRANDGT